MIPAYSMTTLYHDNPNSNVLHVGLFTAANNIKTKEKMACRQWNIYIVYIRFAIWTLSMVYYIAIYIIFRNDFITILLICFFFFHSNKKLEFIIIVRFITFHVLLLQITGMTPLMYAVKDNRVSYLDRLIDLGSDIMARNNVCFLLVQWKILKLRLASCVPFSIK